MPVICRIKWQGSRHHALVQSYPYERSSKSRGTVSVSAYCNLTVTAATPTPSIVAELRAVHYR